MAIDILSQEGFGDFLGKNIGTGLAQGINQLANMKLNQYAANQQRQQIQQGLSSLFTPEQAQALSGLDPQLLSPIIKELINQPRRAAFGNAVAGLQKQLFPSAPGTPGETTEQQPLDLSQLSPSEALQLINTQLNAESRRSQQEEKQREFNEAQELKKEKQNLAYAKEVRPFIEKKAQENLDFSKARKLAERMKSNLMQNKSKFPGALVGNLPEAGRRAFIRNKDVRKFIADADKLVLLLSNTRKGQPTNYKTQLERFAKADISQPVQTMEEILNDVISDADVSEQENRFIGSSKNKETGRYPLDIAQRLSNFEIQQREGLPNPYDYSEDTIIEVNGKTFKRNEDSWEEVKG